MLTEHEAEEFRIRRVIETWAIARDSGDWATFASVWHDDGWMTATWFQGRPPSSSGSARPGSRQA